ncbi:MAG: efflux RND transporter permease subunit [Pseudomonadota bacterium]
MKTIIAWFANNHVAANLLMGLIILAGLFTLPQMPTKAFPDIDIPMISISVPYLGAAPEEVEEGVCIRIEEELEGIEGVKQISSTANEGICSVQVELFEDADESKALDDVKNRVDAIDTFPDETEKPIINIVTRTRNVLDVAITGPADERALKELAQQVRDDIVRLPQVTQATVTNTRPYEISIEVSEESLRRNSLSFDEVANAVRRGSLDLPGGSIKTEAGEILLRTKGQAYSGWDFENIVVTTRADGTRLYLRDVATVRDDFADTDQFLRFNGQSAALVKVARLGKQDIQVISNAVKDYIQDVTPRLPEGVTLTIWNDDSVNLKDRLQTLLNSARQGFIFVLILLALFLRPRLAFWVSVGVPVAFLGAIFLTNALGLSINAISLFGFILVLGILVDDAVVVGESIHTHQTELPEQNRLQGAIAGAQRVTTPVVFGVLTTVAAFMPLLFGTGTLGQITNVVAVTVICCLLFSLIESQLVLPSHLGNLSVKTPSAEVGLMLLPILAIFLLGFADSARSFVALAIATLAILLALHTAGLFAPFAEKVMSLQQRFAAGLHHFIHNPFKAATEAALNARYITAALAIVALMSAVAIIASGRLPFSFFPPLASNQVIAKLTMPLGTSVQQTQEAIAALENSANRVKADINARFDEGLPPVTHIMAAVGEQPSAASGNGPPDSNIGVSSGSANGHVGEVTMQLSPGESRPISTREIAQIWRQENGPIADAIELKFDANLFTSGNDIEIQLEGDNVDELSDIARQLRLKLAEYPGVINITDTFRDGKQELKLDILPTGEALGLSLGDLARQVRQAFYGEEAQRIQRGRDDIKVMVRYTEDERRTLAALDDMRVRTATGADVPFSAVADASVGRGFSTIRRNDSRRVVNVIADVDRTQITANTVLEDLRSGPIQEIMAPYPRVTYSLEGQSADQSEAQATLLPLTAVALFIIYMLLAIPLKSYGQPLVIMSVIPFALVGAIWGHLIMKYFGYVSGLAMMSVLGCVAASGVVVNSSLVLVDNINYRRAAGQSLQEAVLNAAVSRCRPIILTSLTTFFGLGPLMLNKGVQAQFLVPMAVSLSFGVLFATVVTLMVVPAGYLILHDIGRVLRRSSNAGSAVHNS